MNIVLVSPLYPPDIAEPASYMKELARRLAGTHTVTVVTYGDHPEQVAGVRILATSKRTRLPVRIPQFTRALWLAAKAADVLFVENGASAELPAVIVSHLRGRPLILHIGDPIAHAHAQQSTLFGALENAARRSARHVLSASPLPRPEILPFEARPVAALAAYEASWDAHLAEITSLLHG